MPVKIPKTEESTLIIQEHSGRSFYNQLHQHPEIQISLIIKGEGTFIAGDNINNFKPDDIFVIGENLPHVFINDDEGEQTQVKMITIFFTKASYGENFFDLKEFNHLREFFESIKMGVKILSYKERIIRRIKSINNYSPYMQFKSFLELLRCLALSRKEILSSPINLKKYTGKDAKVMQNILQYTLHNFHQGIRLKEVADIAHLSDSAFCRYFKHRTNRSYISFVTDMRIANACKLLEKNNKMSISEISLQSGFNNITNFNKKFKEIKGITPTAYRKEHIQ